MARVKPSYNKQLQFGRDVMALTPKMQKRLQESPYHIFRNQIFYHIPEKIFFVLYNNDLGGKPASPIAQRFSALILKEVEHLSYKELMNKLYFDVSLRYAIGSECEADLPFSERSLRDLLYRCESYEIETGIDLIHEAFVKISDGLADFLKTDRKKFRMDSFLFESDIKNLSRQELLFRTNLKAVKSLVRNEVAIPEELAIYLKDNAANKRFYHNQEDLTYEETTKLLIKESEKIMGLFSESLKNDEAYQILERVLDEQTLVDEEGRRLRSSKEEGLSSHTIQSPADIDCDFRQKGDVKSKGYVCNVTEVECQEDTIIVDEQVEVNTVSDSQMLNDYLQKQEASDKEVILATDGAYPTDENRKSAQEKNIQIISGKLNGRETDPFHSEFIFNPDGSLKCCPNGLIPKSISFNSNTGINAFSMNKSTCDECPYKDKCIVKANKKAKNPRTYRGTTSVKSKNRALDQIQWESDQQRYTEIKNFRNGVESIPSDMRNHYDIDSMNHQGRSLVKAKMRVPLKLLARNFKTVANRVRQWFKQGISLPETPAFS